METVKLSRIVMKFTPDLYPFLKPNELNSDIVLLHGMESLGQEDAMEIIHYSIYEHQKQSFIH